MLCFFSPVWDVDNRWPQMRDYLAGVNTPTEVERGAKVYRGQAVRFGAGEGGGRERRSWEGRGSRDIYAQGRVGRVFDVQVVESHVIRNRLFNGISVTLLRPFDRSLGGRLGGVNVRD